MSFCIRSLASAALIYCHLISALVALPHAPEPTPPPQIRDFDHVYERAEGPITETLMAAVAPNNTCGYYGINNASRVTCDNGQNCLYESREFNVVFCSDGIFQTDCMGSVKALDTGICDEYCRRNTNIRKCTNAKRPECFTIYYPDDLKVFICELSSGYQTGFLLPGFSDYSRTTLEVPVYPATTTAASTETSDEPTSTEPKELPAAATDESRDKESGGKKSNTGAIAGGVIGGVVGLAGLGLAMFFIRRRNKKKKQQVPAEVADHSSPQDQQQRWSAMSQPSQAWNQQESRLIPQQSSPQILVEAPDGNAAQVHELDGQGRGRQ